MDSLIQKLYQIGAIKFGNFTLKSGQTSKIYLDLRQIISYPDILCAVSDALWQQVQTTHFDLICGIPYTALPMATCISIQQHIPMIMRRKEKKAYGTKQQIEGKFQAGQHCLIVEDVITTAGSILETVDELEEIGLKIKDIVVLVDREQGGRENLEKRHFQVHAVFTLTNILNTLLNSTVLSQTERDILNELY